ncbi:HNH endonuclease [Enterococcus sp. LJL98]
MIPQKQCNKAGCRNLVNYTVRYCRKHEQVSEKQNYQDRVAKDGKYLHFYNGRSWRTLSRLYRLKNPICEVCLLNNVIKKADVVDHILEVKDRWDLRLDEKNLQSMCHSCHNTKTAEEKRRRKATIKG